MTTEHVELLRQTNSLFDLIKEGLSIDLSASSIRSILDLRETEDDTRKLYDRLLLLNRLYQYSAVIQGHAIELQKTYKTPVLYGLSESIIELNRAIRTEIETLRSILSNIKEQIKIR